MRALRIVTLGWSLLAFLPGCVALGSSIGHVSIRGSVGASMGDPLPDREVQFILPAAYGLDGLDLVLNKPEDFGHQDQSFSVTTNPNGEFSYDLGDHIYHVNCWLFPPLGCFPRQPPPPFLLVRVPGYPGEYYAIQTHDGRFKVFADTGAELALSQAHLAEASATSESGSTDGQRWTIGVINLRFPAR
jgi:hypothetical protein